MSQSCVSVRPHGRRAAFRGPPPFRTPCTTPAPPRAVAPWYIAVPFVLITVLLIAFIIRTRKDPSEEAVPAPAPPATKKKDDKPGGSKKKQ